ncbi:MAG: BrnA antitoxin family protein [Chloroflexi bacterium]|nr:BrnA antitoxin family protein [Chloroflexota bacterium]
MNNKINDTDGPMEEVKIIRDFLPPPAELVFKEETVKVTIALSKESIDFFKDAAKRNHVPYQKMIRRVLDEYTRHHAE